MIRFLSRASASFIMTDPVAKQVFSALARDGQAPGIWTVEQLPALCQQIEAVIEQAKAQDRAIEQRLQEAHTKALETGELHEWGSGEFPVGLSKRLVPLLTMARQALQAQEPIVWERQ